MKFLIAVPLLLLTMLACGESAEFDGKALELRKCRLSAMPFNRVWPGYQRPLSQTKIGYFTTFDLTKGGVFRLTLPAGVTAARVRPFRRAQGRVAAGVFSTKVTHPEFFVVEAGGTEYHVFADAPWKYSPRPGDRYFGPGEHRPGAIIPKSGERIVLDRGAVVHGNLVMLGVTNVTVEGRGILDTSSITRADPNWPGVIAAEKSGLKGVWPVWGASPVYAFKCGRLSISGITFVDSPRWTMNLCDSSDILIDGVKLVGLWRYNADGIDICACSRVTVRNSFLRTFDDCVISRPQIRPGEDTEMRDMNVSNCVLWCDWGVNMKIQHGPIACAVRNVHFRDNDCVNVSARGCWVTTRWGSNGSVIDNASFDDIRFDIPPERVQQLHQLDDRAEFVPTPTKVVALAGVGAYSLGKPADNQGKPGPLDPEFFRFDYRNLAFRNFQVYDGPGHLLTADSPLKCRIDVSTLTAPHFTVRGLVTEDLPPNTKVSIKGDVK